MCGSIFIQGCRKRVGRVGTRPPRFWPDRRRFRAAAARRAALLLANPDFQTLLHPWTKEIQIVLFEFP